MLLPLPVIFCDTNTGVKNTYFFSHSPGIGETNIGVVTPNFFPFPIIGITNTGVKTANFPLFPTLEWDNN